MFLMSGVLETMGALEMELCRVLDENKQLCEQGHFCRKKEDKERWWSMRKALDGRLGELLHELETGILGGYKVYCVIANT